MKTACAFFVRTPGNKQIKTRLASQIGEKHSLALYERSLVCVQELAVQLSNEGVEIVWAVAEYDGPKSPHWCDTGFDAIYTGGGNLGECLALVSKELHQRADRSVLLGSDSPQFTMQDLRPAFAVDAAPMLAGPAVDGGFYMFSSSKLVGLDIWEQAEYSTSTTLKQLMSALDTKVEMLQFHTDFDDFDSLVQVIEDMPKNLSKAQQDFVDYTLALPDLKNYASLSGSARKVL